MTLCRHELDQDICVRCMRETRDALAAELATRPSNEAFAGQYALTQAHATAASKAEARVAALEAALTPSTDTKAAYIAEHQIEVEMLDEDGDSCTEMVTIPWTTIKDIMAMILKRANSAGEPK